MAHWTRAGVRLTLKNAPEEVVELLDLLVKGDCEQAEVYIQAHPEHFNAEFFNGSRWYCYLNGNPGIYNDWQHAEITKDADVVTISAAWTVKSGRSSMMDFLNWIKPWFVVSDSVHAFTICDHFEDAFRQFMITESSECVKEVHESLVRLSGWIDESDPSEIYFDEVEDEQQHNFCGFFRG